MVKEPQTASEEAGKKNLTLPESRGEAKSFPGFRKHKARSETVTMGLKSLNHQGLYKRNSISCWGLYRKLKKSHSWRRAKSVFGLFL